MSEQRGYPLPGAALAYLGANWYTKLRPQWERYLAEARVLGVSERDARLIAASIQHLARQLPQAVDVLGVAKAIMAEGIVQQVDRPEQR